MAPKSQTRYRKLPDELFTMMFANMSAPERNQICYTSKRLRRIVLPFHYRSIKVYGLGKLRKLKEAMDVFEDNAVKPGHYTTSLSVVLISNKKDEEEYVLLRSCFHYKTY